MEELVQDLSCALDESSLKTNGDIPSEASATSPKYDREKKRRTRKRRTVSFSSNMLSNNFCGLAKTSRLSDCSSSSLEELSRDFGSSLNGFNYSAESDDCVSYFNYKKQQNCMGSNKEHCYKRFKEPIFAESDSYTENGVAPLNISRKLRKKRIKKMTVESSPYHKDDMALNNQHKIDKHNTRYRLKNIDHHLKSKSCTTQDHEMTEKGDNACQLKNDEDSLSGSSLSDNDSNNEDEGQDGDDEMTDYYAEPDPAEESFHFPGYRLYPFTKNRFYLLTQCQAQMADENMDTSLVDSKLREIYHGQSVAIPESMKGYHSRMNRLPGLAARSIRRARRRPKLKKIHQTVGNNERQDTELNNDLKVVNTKRRRMNENGFDFLQAMLNSSIPEDKQLVLDMKLEQSNNSSTKGFDLKMDAT